MTQIWTASAHAILSLGPGVQTAGAHYDKQFGPLPGSQIWGVLLVISFFVLLAGCAAWFSMGEPRAAKGRMNPKKFKKTDSENGVDNHLLPVVSKKRIQPRKSGKQRAKRNNKKDV